MTDIANGRLPKTWSAALRDALISGSIASVTSAIVLVVAGQRESADPAGPINGPSQWLWGRLAPYRRGPSVKYTATGYLVHHLSSIFWAIMYEKLRGKQQQASTQIESAIAVSAAACFVDYRLTPQRFTPGFEKRLSKRALFFVYAAFGVGMLAGSLRGETK